MFILIVEPNDILRQLLCVTFQNFGYIPTEATSGTEAIKILILQSFDVVVTEMKIGSLDGMALRSWLKKEAPNTYVIMFTGTPQDTLVRSAFDAYFLKPTRMSLLMNEVIRLNTLPARL